MVGRSKGDEGWWTEVGVERMPNCPVGSGLRSFPGHGACGAKTMLVPGKPGSWSLQPRRRVWRETLGQGGWG